VLQEEWVMRGAPGAAMAAQVWGVVTGVRENSGMKNCATHKPRREPWTI